MKKIYLLAEGGGDLGNGHIIRSYSLCERLEILKKIIPIIKYHSKTPPSNFQGLFNEKIKFIKDEKEFLIVDNAVIIIDGYTFDIDYLNKFNLKKNKIIFIADVHEKVPNCEILINHLSIVFLIQMFLKIY